MSYREELRKNLRGNEPSDPISYRDQVRMDLGVKPDTRIKASTNQGMLAQPENTLQNVAAGKVSAEKFAASAKKAGKEVGEPTRSLLQKAGSFLKSTGRVLNDLPLNNLAIAAQNTMSFGLTDMVSRNLGQETKERQEKRNRSPAGIAGRVVGTIQPGAAAEKVAATLLRPLIKNAPKVVQGLSRGTGAGAIYAGASETGKALTNDDDLNLEQRLKRAGIETAIGGGSGAAAPLVGKVVKAGLSRLRGNTVPSLNSESKPKFDVEEFRRKAMDKELNEVMGVNQDDMLHIPKVPKEVGQQFDAHGMVRGGVSGELRNLVKLLDDGIDTSKPFHTARLMDNGNLESFKGGSFTVLSAPGKSLPKDGIKNVIVNDAYYDAVDALQHAYPKVKFIRADELSTALPDIAASAPPMKGNWFTNLFGNQGVGISPFGSSKRVGNKPLTTKDAIVNKSIKNDTEGFKASAAAQARSAYQNFVDALSPLKKINSNVYDAAIDASRANNIANNIVGKDFVTAEGVRIGDGMESIFKKVARGQDKDFLDYLILRDAEIRVPRGERVYDESLNMTPDNIRKRIEMYDKRHPGFAAISKDWDSFTKNLRETFGVKEGLITQSQNAAMEASRPFYIKMNRQFSKSEKPGRKWLQGSSGSAFSGQKAPIKKVSPTGSVRGIVDPRKTMIESVGLWVNSAMRNRAMQEVVKAIRQNPQGLKGVAEIVPETAEVTQRSLKEVNDILESDGMEGLLEQLNGDFELAFKKGAQKGTDDNIVRVMVDGNPVRVRLYDPEVVKAVTAMGPQQSGIIVDILSTMSNATKRGATGALAPLFAAKSVTTDLVQSLIQSKNPARHSVDLVHAVFSSIGDKFNIPGLRNLAKEFRLSGGEYSAALRGERQLNKSLGRLKRDPILSPQNIGRQTKNLVASPFKIGESISDVSENINRIAAYRGEMRRLGGERTPENVRRAINEAREITTNYSRKGALSKELEAAFPYQNAAVQGTYRVMKGFKQNPVKTTAAVFSLAIAPKLLEYAQFHDDPDYQKLPARERMRNMIISKNDDGTFVKIPMEPAYNSFGEMTIQTLSYLKDNDPDAFKGTLDALANAWTPPILTGALQGATQGTGVEGSVGGLLNAMSPAPVLGATYNQSFTGAPIVPQRLESRSDKNQFDERTSTPAKWIGEKLKMAPMKVDYLLRAYGGDAARLLLPLTSDMGAGTPRNTLLKNFIVDPQFSNTLADDFYSAKDKFLNVKTDHKDVGDPLPKWYTEELDKLVNSRSKHSVTIRLSNLNDDKRAINGNRSLSSAQKAQQLRDIQAEINEIYLDVNSKLAAAGVPMPNR